MDNKKRILRNVKNQVKKELNEIKNQNTETIVDRVLEIKNIMEIRVKLLEEVIAKSDALNRKKLTLFKYSWNKYMVLQNNNKRNVWAVIMPGNIKFHRHLLKNELLKSDKIKKNMPDYLNW